MPDDGERLIHILRTRLAGRSPGALVEEVGRVAEVGDGVARIEGLDLAKSGELLEFEGGARGLVLSLEEASVGAALLGALTPVRQGETVRTTGRPVMVPVGNELLGRVINALGDPMDGKGAIAASQTRSAEGPAPGVIQRRPVNRPLQTGIKAIDAMVPIGRGQRELIIGDRGTGKSALAVDAILNQTGGDVVCVYVAIGQKASTIARLIAMLEERGALPHTVLVAAPASEPAPMQYLAPFTGCAVAEFFMYEGRDALIVYDDLSKHAVAYRAMSLLLRRPPGREAFPGDVFYLHARLLERAAQLDDPFGGGSLTALPIVETLAGDISAYIPTNVISITDGQIYLDNELFYSGIRPAVNAGLSISRVGGAAQLPVMKKVAGRLRLELAQYRELASFARFGANLEKSTQARLDRGERLAELMKQAPHRPMPVFEQIAAIHALTAGFADGLPTASVPEFEERFLGRLRTQTGGLSESIAYQKELPPELEQSMDRIAREVALGLSQTKTGNPIPEKAPLPAMEGRTGGA